MAIVEMNRFTLFTFEQYKQPLLKALQKFEQVHFRRLQPEDFDGSIKRNVEHAAHFENELAHVNFAADRLKPLAALPTGMAALTTSPKEMTFDELDAYIAGYDYATVCKAVRDCDERLKALRSEASKLTAENEALRLWTKLDVAPAELDRLKSVRYTIGAVNKNSAQTFVVGIESAFPNAYIETLHTVKDDTVFFVMGPTNQWDGISAEIKNSGFTKSAINFTVLPAVKVKENQSRINELEKAVEAVNKELEAQASQYERLKITADYFRTALERAKSCENFMNLSNVLIIEGWVPTENSQQLSKILDTACQGNFYIEEKPVEKDSQDVPICLRNKGMVSAFESITSMYSLPKYAELDPTPLLAPFYMLFFGIMVGDAGYGLLLVLGTTLALKYFKGLADGMRNFLKFFFYLGFATMAMGTVFGSFFGVTFFAPLTAADGSPKAILDSQADITFMIILSIVIGVIQVLFGISVKGYILIRDGKILDAIFDSLFWIVALVSGIAWILCAAGVVPAGLSTLCMILFFGSLFGIAATAGRESPSLGGKIGNGLYSVYGITGYVGDLVSYTRLVALSLSGAFIAYSFNLMAGLMPNMFLKVVAGSLIFVFGQTLNFGLAALGAYVHSCRLQYVEYFGKFYEGGGVAFKPLTPKNVFVRLKRV